MADKKVLRAKRKFKNLLRSDKSNWLWNVASHITAILMTLARRTDRQGILQNNIAFFMPVACSSPLTVLPKMIAFQIRIMLGDRVSTSGKKSSEQARFLRWRQKETRSNRQIGCDV